MFPTVFITLSFLKNLFLRPPKTPPPLDTYKIIDVIDGDTIVTEKSQKVRLLSVDSSELSLCGSLEAKQQLETLVKNKNVYLKEIVADRYSRLVALVYLGKTFVNGEMVKSGWGRYNSINSTQSDLLLYYSQIAQANKLGVYSSLCRQIENPQNPKCVIKGNASRDGRQLYFFPSCSDYSRVIVEKDLGDQWFCTEAEAKKANYIKSENCYEKTYGQ
ncbi:MAG: thermonuclease family protein [Candidatus Shapirobacteria bacterium]